MPASEISLDQAKQNKLFYFVANVIVYREEDKRCLILKRHEREKTHPNKWAVCGGKMEWSDLPIDNPTRMNGEVIDFENAIESLLKREAEEESGLKIHDTIKYINNVAFIRPDAVPVVMIKFVAEYKSGEIKLEEGGFTDYAWVNAEEIKDYDCILGIKEEVAKAIKLMNK